MGRLRGSTTTPPLGLALRRLHPEEQPMATVAQDVHTAYLIDVQADWLRHLKNDVLEPVAAAALAHPVLKDIEAGRLPKDKFARMMANLC